MRFIILFCTILTALNTYAAKMLQNGDFNGKNMFIDFTYKTIGGSLTLSDFTEDRTWNKCLKVKLASFKEFPNGRRFLASELIFGKKGFSVEPGKVYSFSFDFKGNMPVSMFVNCYASLIETPKVKPLQSIRPNPRVATPDKNNWTKVTGNFKVPANTKYITFTLRFWADSSVQRNFSSQIGDSVLLDNIKLEQKSSLDDLSTNTKSEKQVVKKRIYLTNDKVIKNLDFIYFPWLKNVAKLPVNLQWNIKDNKFFMTFQLQDNKKISSPKSKNNSKDIYLDDVAEVFFVDSQGSYHQFACSSSGGRYQTKNGNTNAKYNLWKASTFRHNGKITYRFEIPFKLFTANGVLPSGEIIKFNIAFKYNNVFYSLAPVKTKFSEIDNFSLMLVGSINDFQKKSVALLRKSAPTKVLNKINAFANKTYTNITDANYDFEVLKKEIISIKMGTAPFILATLPLESNYTYPLEIAPENVITKPIKLQAAKNEITSFPLVICNRTNSAAAYRVVIHDDAKNFSKFENPTLSNNFPVENIILREAVPVKDSEGKNPTQILDALPKMNEAQTLTIPAKSSGLVWIEFSTKKVKSALYKGFIRVIPLAEPAIHTNKKYVGAIQDLPISLEVLPIDLPQLDNSWLCAYGGTDDYFKYLRQLGAGRINISLFAFKFRFDNKGNIIDDNNSTKNAISIIKSNLAAYQKNNAMHVKVKFMFAYSMAKIFEEIVLPKSIKPMSKEWENCWTNYLKEIRKIVHKCNLTMEDFVIELYDEPNGKIHDKLLRMTQLARQAIPEGKFTITWPPQKFNYTADLMQEYDDLLDEQMFHYLLHKDPAYLPQIKKIQKKKGVTTGLYQCSTNIREDLYSYYRLHPWIVFQGNYDVMGFYNLAAVNWGQLGASDWKRVPYGAIVYRSRNNCIPSIRFMLLRKGVDDIRYLTMLKKYNHIDEVAKFLVDESLKVVTFAHNKVLANEVRKKAINLLLKYHK